MDQDVKNVTQDFQKKISNFEQKVEARYGAETIEKSKDQLQKLNPEDLTVWVQQSVDLTNKLVEAIKEEKDPASIEVQNLLDEHYDLTTKMQNMNKEEYLKSRAMLKEAPEFYATLHLKFPDFMYEAMGIYAQKRWQ